MKKIFTLLFSLVLSFTAFCQTATDVIVPQYMQGVNGTNANRIPAYWRETFTGLTPNATYRYYTSVIEAAESATANGAGNSIFVSPGGFSFAAANQSLATAGAYGQFTTDGAGSYTGWFGVEPTGNASRFTPGTTVKFRVVLNDGAGGTTAALRLTTTATATVINFGANPTDGTAIRSTATSGTPKNFVALFDNVAGTGRPLTVASIEDDGLTAGSSWSAFYKTNVDAATTTWGTIIPNAAPNGVRNISQYSVTSGSLVYANTSADGTWPASPNGTVSTVNPNGGTTSVIVLDGSQVALPVNLLSFNAALNNKIVNLDWSTANETNVAIFELERSVNGKDFSRISSVSAKNAQLNNYNFIDEKPTAGTNFYRLKMIDKDGSFKYSSIVTVKTKSEGISVFPNPVKANFTVQHETGVKGATISIIDFAGKQVMNVNVQQGATQTSLDASKLTPGSYMIVLNNDGVKLTKQFVKQ